MRRFHAPLYLAILSLGLAAWVSKAPAADEIKGPDSVPVYTLATVTTDVPADAFIWLTFPPETTYEATQADPKVLQFTGGPGPHLVMLVPLKGGVPTGKFRKTVTFGDPGPPPPPIPDKPPKPPTPTPPPVPVPQGFRAIIVAETEQAMTRGQLNVLNSTTVVDYLNSHTAKDANGRASWRKWDPDVDTSNESAEWKEMWASAKQVLGPLPCVVLFNGQAGKSYPLPQTEAELLGLMRTYGGP